MRTYTTGRGSYEGTRERLVKLLREGPKSVHQLASGLNITLNAVRSQITLMERDGFVRMVGERRGHRRPSLIYGLTSEAERHLSRAYAPVLKAVLGAMSSMNAEDQVERILREAGRRLADEVGQPSGDFQTRVAMALSVLEDLGGSAVVEEVEGKLVVRGHGCPLAEAVSTEPKTCKCMETFLSELIGTQVVERCERGEKKRCSFVISREEELP